MSLSRVLFAVPLLVLALGACGSAATDDLDSAAPPWAGDTTVSTAEESTESGSGSGSGSEPGSEPGSDDGGIVGSEAADDPAPVVEDAPARLAAVAPLENDELLLSIGTSARFEGAFDIEGGVGTPPGTMTMEGAFDQEADAVDLTMDLSGLVSTDGDVDAELAGLELFFDEPLRMVRIGDEAWMQWTLLTLFSGGGGSWVPLTEEIGGSAEELGFESSATNPAEVFSSVAGSAGDLVPVGIETVRGVETVHWEATLDDPSMGGGTGEFALWLGADDGLLHRFEVDTVDPEDGPLKAWFEFFDHGAAVEIQPPDADDIADVESLSLG